MKGCPKGHEVIHEEDNYCWLCGNKLIYINPIRCMCGYGFKHEDKFCPNCGTARPIPKPIEKPKTEVRKESHV